MILLSADLPPRDDPDGRKEDRIMGTLGEASLCSAACIDGADLAGPATVGLLRREMAGPVAVEKPRCGREAPEGIGQWSGR